MSYQLYINGVWKNAHDGDTHDVINPATEEIVFNTAYGKAKDANEAIEAATNALSKWKQTNAFERAKYLKAIAQLMREYAADFASITTQESGKPFVEANGEWLVSADIFEWFAEEAKRTYGMVLPASKNDKRMSVIWQPMGVVGMITAWNFPVWNLARPWAAALAAGCTIVAKPSEFTPISAVLLTRLIEKAGISKGVVNLVNGDASSIGDTMLQDKRIKKIHFVGSTRVGKLLMDKASITNTKLSLELGGNAPLIVFDDVDVEKIAIDAAKAKFRNCGQVCVSPQRFLIQNTIYDRFITAFTNQTAKLQVGNGLEKTTNIGPLINKKQQNYIADLVDKDVQNGVEIVMGGEKTSGKGYFYPPTILKHVTDKHATFTQEIFGPVVPMISFNTVEEVIELANATEYGLAAYLFTNHIQRITQITEALEFGMVAVNEWTPHGTEAPFGGWKQSGSGSELGPDGIYEYMEKKLISIGSL